MGGPLVDKGLAADVAVHGDGVGFEIAYPAGKREIDVKGMDVGPAG